MRFRNVQQPGHAESNAADLGKPSADAEHALGSLHAQYDAVALSKPRVGLPGMQQKDVNKQTQTIHTKPRVQKTGTRHITVQVPVI